jgi:hypothetical protein
LTPEDGFPPLPKVDLLLYKAPGTSSPAVDALHDYLVRYIGLSEGGAIGQRPLPKDDGGPRLQAVVEANRKPRATLPQGR